LGNREVISLRDNAERAKSARRVQGSYFMSIGKFGRFLRDERGNYATIFALTVFPILGAASAAVDYTNLQRHRGAVQNALDAAALATAKEYSNGVTGNALKAYAEDFFDATLSSFVDPNKVKIAVEVKDENIIDTNGDPAVVKTVKLDADLDYDSFIAKVVGHKQFDIGIASQVALGNITVEIALVVDNSGSMASKSKIQTARSTAKDLVDTIFAAAANSNKPNPVSFSLVPFASMVNVGASNATAKWMDTNGWSPIHHENLNWKSWITTNSTQFNGAGFQEKISNVWKWKSRFDLYTKMDIPWLGCVEMRPWPHNTLDTSATASAATGGMVQVNQNSSAYDRGALFVPLFAPDEPDSTYAYKSGSSTKHSNDEDSYDNDYAYDWKRPKATNPNQTEQIYYNTSFTGYNNGTPFNYGNGVIDDYQNKRQDFIFRYQADTFGSGEKGSAKGPNYGCTIPAITALSTTKSTIKDKIDDFVSNGNTNIQHGVAWGWRTLTPKEPFTGGRDASDETNRKYMIVLTDGENTYNSQSTPNETYFGPWGYGKHDRIEQGMTASDRVGTPYVGVNLNTYEKKMNLHTVQTCNNAKKDGVTIFTIAFDISDGSSAKELLAACAGSGVVNNKLVMQNGTFYYDVSASGLQSAMAAIAAQISTMRIMR